MNFLFLIPLLVGGVGAFLLLRLKFFFILHPKRTLREIRAEMKDRSVRRSFFLALAGTLGVGNILGVATGIIIGGPGMIFWLAVSSVFAMIIKYAETLLVFDCGCDTGGMANTIRKLCPKLGGIISPFYAALTLMLSLLMGAAMQSRAFFDTAENSLGIKPITSATILLILISPCFLSDGRKIENITEKVIPMTTIIYIIMCLGAIFINFSKIGETVLMILKSAFNLKSASGAAAFIAIKEGFARGILSNEAGTGSSAMAHSRSINRSPHRAGLFAMCEVVFDSILCILTGLVILLTVNDSSSLSSPMAIVTQAFYSVYGDYALFVLPIIIFAFAYSTIVCWFYYGSECGGLFCPSSYFVFSIVFSLFIVFSSMVGSTLLIYIVDFILLMMSIITLSVIIKESSRIVRASYLEVEKKNPK